MLCCKDDCNKGATVLASGQFNANQAWYDPNQCSDMMSKLFDAGIRTLFVDLTNSPQWEPLPGNNQFTGVTVPSLSNIIATGLAKGMTFAAMIGDQGPGWTEADTAARLDVLYNNWATSPQYEKYRFGTVAEGKGKPMLIAFDNGNNNGNSFLNFVNTWSPTNKAKLARFKLVDCGSTTLNGGFGYRARQQSTGVTNGVAWHRFVSTNGSSGAPTTWFRANAQAWKTEVEWARAASRYSVYGSYDDTCDAHMWGVAETALATTATNIYPGNDSRLYYNVVQDAVVGKTTLKRLIKSNSPGFSIDGGGNVTSATPPAGGNNQQVFLYTSSATNANQQWREVSRGGGYFSYVKSGTNFALDGGNGAANNQKVILYIEDSNNQNQQWRKISVGNGLSRLEKRNNPGFSIDGSAGGANGQGIVLWPNESVQKNQFWDVKSL